MHNTWLPPPSQALRLIFGALHMPGEAQKVDRIMQERPSRSLAWSSLVLQLRLSALAA